MLPSFWVLYRRELEAVVKVHFMDEQLNNGPIQERPGAVILPGDTRDSLMCRTNGLGPAVELTGWQIW